MSGAGRRRFKFGDGPGDLSVRTVSILQSDRWIAIPAPCIVPSLIGAKVEAVWQYVFQHLQGPERTGVRLR